MAYFARLAVPEDRADVLRLWKDNMSDPRIGDVLDARYQWLYDRNPAGSPTTIVAIHAERREAVGCGSVYPRRMRVGNATIMAAVPADFAVDRRHRLGGAALMIQRALIDGRENGPAFFFGFPNRSSLPILQRVGYKPIGPAQGWVKPLRAAHKLRQYVPDRLARMAALPVDLYLAVADTLRAGGGDRRDEILERADERFDQLWERAKGRYGLTGERTSSYLNWRYAEFTTRTHQFFCRWDASHSNLLGYIVFTTTDRKVSIVDLFAVDMEQTADDLLIAFARRMRRAGYVSIFLAFAGHAGFVARLPHLGFYASRTSRRDLVALVNGLSPEHQALVFDSRNWFMFDGEMDI